MNRRPNVTNLITIGQLLEITFNGATKSETPWQSNDVSFHGVTKYETPWHRNVKLMAQSLDDCTGYRWHGISCTPEISFDILLKSLRNGIYDIDGRMYKVSDAFERVLKVTFETALRVRYYLHYQALQQQQQRQMGTPDVRNCTMMMAPPAPQLEGNLWRFFRDVHSAELEHRLWIPVQWVLNPLGSGHPIYHSGVWANKYNLEGRLFRLDTMD